MLMCPVCSQFLFLMILLTGIGSESNFYLQIQLNMRNQTEKALGPFEVWLSQNDLQDDEAVMINGLQTMVMLVKLAINDIMSICCHCSALFYLKTSSCICCIFCIRLMYQMIFLLCEYKFIVYLNCMLKIWIENNIVSIAAVNCLKF